MSSCCSPVSQQGLVKTVSVKFTQALIFVVVLFLETFCNRLKGGGGEGGSRLSVHFPLKKLSLLVFRASSARFNWDLQVT